MILEAEMTGWSKGKKIPRRYRAVIRYAVYGPMICIEEEIGEGVNAHWIPTPGSWYLKTLIESKTVDDMIYIDHGQQWVVGGMREAMAEALRRLVKRGGGVDGRQEVAEAEDTSGGNT